MAGDIKSTFTHKLRRWMYVAAAHSHRLSYDNMKVFLLQIAVIALLQSSSAVVYGNENDTSSPMGYKKLRLKGALVSLS